MPRRLSTAGPRLLLAAALAVAVALVGAVDLFRKVESFRPLGFTAHSRGGAWRVTAVQSWSDLPMRTVAFCTPASVSLAMTCSRTTPSGRSAQ